MIDLSTAAANTVVALPVAAAGSIRGKLSGASNPQEFSVALIGADPDSGAESVQVVFPDSAGKFSFRRSAPRDAIASPRNRRAPPPAPAGSRDAAHMIEIQIVAGAPTEMELPAPRSQQ